MSEEKQIIQYDPSKLMEMVRDRIRATYVSLIPEEQWSQMVKKEIDAFFVEREGYRNYERMSNFKQVVYGELEKKAKEIAKQYLDSISSNDWEGNVLKPSDFVKELFAEHAGKILLSTLGNMVQQAVNNSKQY